MQKSNSLTNIAKALALFHIKMGKVSKDATNPFFKSKYASLSNILDQIQVPMQEAGLVVTQFPDGDHGLTSILIHPESGEYLEATYNICPVKNDPQAIGSAITYARRYALGAILGLNIDEDDDGNGASGKSDKPVDNRPWLNKGTVEFKGAIEKLKKGETTIEKIEAAMKLSKEIKAELTKIPTPVKQN